MAVEIDGRTLARAATSQPAWTITEQLVYLSLGPGDIVLTDAPGTYAAVTPGHRRSITLTGIGTLSNPVRGR